MAFDFRALRTYAAAVILFGCAITLAIDAHSQQPGPIGMLLATGDITECLIKKDTDPLTSENEKEREAAKENVKNKSGAATAALVREEIAKAKAKHPNLPIRVLALGDLAYDCGATRAFKCFDKTWGQFETDGILLPVPGNHEYDYKKDDVCVPSKAKKDQIKANKHAKPFFAYFKKNEFAKKEQAVSVLRFPDTTNGPWVLVGLNLYVPGLGADEFGDRLKARLAQESGFRCVLAFSHAGRYSSGRHGHGQSRDDSINLEAALVPTKLLGPSFRVLHEARASVLVAGHDHHYEQLGRASADADPGDKGATAMPKDGVRSFIVGTGGTDLHSESKKGNDYRDKWAFTEAYDLHSRGVLRITLYETRYEWAFIPTKDNAASMIVIKNVSSDNCNRP